MGTLTFNVYPFTVQLLPPGESTLFFATAPLTPLVDTGLEDADGVRMVMVGGKEYNHVSAQARYGLANVNAYRATGDVVYLTRAEVQAQRLIDRAVDSGGAWFHPYDFQWGSMWPPWYSALGQGYALSLFSRLYELTGDETYQEAAEDTFASYLEPGPAATPWVVEVDPDGYLWLQEYPGSANEGVFNGFMVAALGIYDYYRVTGDPDALALFRGAATTVADYAASYRRAGWRSLYCLGDRLTASAAYHEVVVQQMLALYTITGDCRFARWATIFENDFPRPALSGRATVTAGRHAVVRFSATGAVLGAATLVATATLHVAVSERERIHGHTGSWLLLAGGAQGLLDPRERAPRVRARRARGACVLTAAYAPPARGALHLPRLLAERRRDLDDGALGKRSDDHPGRLPRRRRRGSAGARRERPVRRGLVYGFRAAACRRRASEMDARVKRHGVIFLAHGGGSWSRATVATATTTVTLRCAGRNRRTVSGRELPRTRVASRDRIEQSRVLREVAAVAGLQLGGCGSCLKHRLPAREVDRWSRPTGSRPARGRPRRWRRWSACRAR